MAKSGLGEWPAFPTCQIRPQRGTSRRPAGSEKLPDEGGTAALSPCLREETTEQDLSGAVEISGPPQLINGDPGAREGTLSLPPLS